MVIRSDGKPQLTFLPSITPVAFMLRFLEWNLSLNSMDV